jgi:hypothetical protein
MNRPIRVLNPFSRLESFDCVARLQTRPDPISLTARTTSFSEHFHHNWAVHAASWQTFPLKHARLIQELAFSRDLQKVRYPVRGRRQNDELDAGCQ